MPRSSQRPAGAEGRDPAAKKPARVAEAARIARAVAAKKPAVAAKTPPNWTVKEALEDGQAAVRRGSGLPLRPSTEEALIDHYRNFFEDQWKAGADWHGARGHIMMLGQLVGGLACLITMVKDFVNKRSAPVSVDARSAVQAAELVAWVATLCWMGGWCPNSTSLAETLKSIQTDLGLFEGGAELSRAQADQLERISEALAGALGPSR